MTADLAKFAKDKKIKFFLFNFTDLFGTQRAKSFAGRQQEADARHRGPLSPRNGRR